MTYHVSSARPDDSGDGLSLGTAKKTIQAGIALLTMEDTLNIHPGTYVLADIVTFNRSIRTILFTSS